MRICETPPSRPVYIAEESPDNSYFNWMVKAPNSTLQVIREQLIMIGHNIITNAKSMKDLGYSSKTYIDGSPNFHNCLLSSKIFDYDLDLYTHLIHKVTDLIEKGVLSRKDHLGIISHHIPDMNKDSCGMAITKYVSSVTAIPSYTMSS